MKAIAMTRCGIIGMLVVLSAGACTVPSPLPVAVPEPAVAAPAELRLDCPVDNPLGGVQPRCKIGSERTELLIINSTDVSIKGIATMGLLVRDFSIGPGFHKSLVGDCADRMGFGVIGGVTFDTPIGTVINNDGIEFVEGVDYLCGTSLAVEVTLSADFLTTHYMPKVYSTGPALVP